MTRVAGPPAEVPADEERIDGLGLAACGLDGVGEPCPELDLVDPRPRDRAGDGHERGAGLGPRAERPEPRCAETHDESEVGERLDVLNERGRAAEAALEGIRGLRRRLRGPTGYPGEERSLLSRDERVRHLRQPPLNAVASLRD